MKAVKAISFTLKGSNIEVDPSVLDLVRKVDSIRITGTA
jgi:hypothetical protein